MQIVDGDYDDSDDDTFVILLTLRGSSPISQEVSKLVQRSVCTSVPVQCLEREYYCRESKT